MNDLILAPKIDQSPVAITVGALERARRLTGACKLISRIPNMALATRGTQSARAARGFIKEVEEARQALVAPALKLQRDVNAQAASLVASLEAEVKRIEGLLTQFMFAERKREKEAQEAAQRAADEANRLAAEQAAQVRQQAETKAQSISDPVQAQQALDLGAASAKQIVAAAAVPVVPVSPRRPLGMRLREDVWKYRVVDPLALANHDKNLVRIEVVASAVKELINSGTRTLPGLEIYQETSVGTTA